MKKIIFLAALVAALAGCASFNQGVVDPLITTISRINKTAIPDLQTAIAVANAATPPDADGAQCAASAIVVAGQINIVLAAAKGTPAVAATATTSAVPATTAGAFTTIEIASIFAPGSAQYQQVQQKLITGCAAKAQDVLGATGLLAAGGVIGALAAGQILPLALP